MHSIRLRGPWELYLPESEAPRRVEMPATWQTLLALAAEFPLPSPARFVRRFGLPTGLAADDRLYLVIQSTAADFGAELNRQRLGHITPSLHSSKWDVTQWLSQRNELVLLLEFPQPGGVQPDQQSAPFSDVRLEIVGASG